MCFVMHWLFGMVYVFYFASFILMLREVLRPGVLFFLRNLNDPDFNPIQEMIHLPILRHIRRFLFSMIIFGTTVLLMVWLPIRIIKKGIPKFLPYTFVFTTEQAHELSLELVLLQVMMPALLEQGHTREWMKTSIKWWCIAISWILDLRSYLLGDVPMEDDDPVAYEVVDDHNNGDENNVDVEDDNANEEVQPDADGEQVENNPVQNPGPAVGGGLGFVIAGGGLGAAHQALLLRDSPTGFTEYKRPAFFPLKIIALILSMCATLTISSVSVLTIPVGIGRIAMSYWLTTATNSAEPIHELYTAATGLYLTWLSIRLGILIGTWLPRSNKVGKATIAVGLLVGVVPYLSGLLFELVLFSPMRVPLHQSPIYLTSENWIMGTLCVKIACATTMMTPPNFWLRRTLERIYNDGFRNMNLNIIIRDLAAPCIVWLGLALSIPYVISHSLVPIFVRDFATQNSISRRIYPFILIIGGIIGIIYFQIRQFKKLYEHIKNDKYLVGRRLVNYERPSPVITPPVNSLVAPVVAAHPPNLAPPHPNLLVN
ncbi:E3 ubiquitin-protein ligase MARCH6 [Folsomia candida]|uniref:RING-type E3 ubiquitin transferase n=1 Tax=Folsomia candida TaxID=158441 RepID=A0A226EZT0_FOLCA|nr:E3 ubiquitin-protein ligase MARCH6 [Folsomia candida]